MNMVRKLSVLFILLSIFIAPYVYAHTVYEEVQIGKVEVGEEGFIYNGERYSLYQVNNQLYLPLKELKQMGLEVSKKGEIFYLKENQENRNLSIEIIRDLQGKTAMMSPYPIYCGNIRSFMLQVNGEILVPLDALRAIWILNEKEGTYEQECYLNNELVLIQIDAEGIENVSEHLLPITCAHLFWDGKTFQIIEEYFLLEPHIKQPLNIGTKQMYLTTFITEISELPIEQEGSSIYGQKSIETFRRYSDSIRLKQLEAYFPPYVILAEMRYGVGPFKAKEIVELFRSEKHLYFLVKDQLDHKYQVPYNSIRVIGEKGVHLPNVSNQDIEDFATLSGMSSATDYLIWTDIYRQRTYVLKKAESRWVLEKTMVCSTGKIHNPTPTGTYEIQYIIPYIGVEKGYRCKYALVFFRDYMYHSILFDQSGKYIKSGQYELGSKASHGCVRLSEKDSAWLYEHIPVKSMVWIR